MSQNKRQRLGLFGGTFNPIHMGHLVIAEAVREEYELDHVLFIPAATPPHKVGTIVDVAHRCEMVRLAIESNPYFSVSEIEMARIGPSYTIHTVQALKEIYGEETDMFFIAGTDTIQDLPNWKYIKELLGLCEFVGATRPDGTQIIDNVIEYFGPLGSRIHSLNTPELEISSTDLRRRLEMGRTVKYMVPDAVLEYIWKEKVYR